MGGKPRLPRCLIETPFEIPLAVLYLLYGLAEITLGLVATPNSIYYLVPAFMVFMWAAALALGGALTLIGRFTGRLRTEAVGLVAATYGLLMYAAALGAVRSLRSVAFSLLLLVALAAGTGLRARVVQRAIQARRIAQHIRMDNQR